MSHGDAMDIVVYLLCTAGVMAGTALMLWGRDDYWGIGSEPVDDDVDGKT